MNGEMVSVYVDTDANIDQDMLEALTCFEFHCCMELRTEAQTDEISAFLADRYGNEMASRFKPEMMLRVPVTSVVQE